MTDAIPVYDPDELVDGDAERAGTVIGVILAAGGSDRFGDRNKLLEPIDGDPMIRRVVETFSRSSLDHVIMVVGAGADDIREAVGGIAITIVDNSDWREGQSSSVTRGLEAAMDRDAEAVVFGLGDMPWVARETIDRIVATYRHHEAPIIAAAYDGDRGNPVLFADAVFEELATVTGDRGGRELIESISGAIAIETGDPGVRRDVDRPPDLPDGGDAS